MTAKIILLAVAVIGFVVSTVVTQNSVTRLICMIGAAATFGVMASVVFS